MASEKALRKLLLDAAQAHTDLNTFGSVVSLLEGGHVYGTAGSQLAASRIIDICQRQIQKCLRAYDAACDAAIAIRPKPTDPEMMEEML